MVILEGHRCGLVGNDSNRSDCCVTIPVGIGYSYLFGVVLAGSQIGYCNRAVGSGSERRARNSCGTGGVRVQTDLPATDVFTGVRRLDQLHTAFDQAVVERHRCCTACRDGHLLGVGAGTGILAVDAGIRMSQFLHVIGSCIESGYGDPAGGIRGVRTGNQ